MTDSSCRQFRGDPEAFSTHPESCVACAGILEEITQFDREFAAHATLQGVPSLEPLDSRNLPIASWEGASERAWPLAVLGALALVFLAVILFLLSGISPAEGFRAALMSQLPRFELFEIASVVGEGLRAAPLRVHVLILVGFTVINVIFLWLLRRAPRGVDAGR
jgi:hypothetical protein